MRRLIIAILAALAALTANMPAGAQTAIQVGLLSCEVAPGFGLLLGSQKQAGCAFSREGFPTELYEGRITKVGLDIGFTARTRIEWLVFTATDAPFEPGMLRGTYLGASGEATFGVGVGANWLVGGSRQQVMLQPWSVQAQTGINLAIGVTGLRLE